MVNGGAPIPIAQILEGKKSGKWISNKVSEGVFAREYVRCVTNVRQRIIPLWAFFFFSVMVCVASAMSSFGSESEWILKVVGTKTAAANAVFLYAAVGWLLSNGMILNPVYRPDENRIQAP